MAAEPETATVPLKEAARSAEPERLAVAPFSAWTYENAAEAVGLLVPEDFAVRKAYAEDEHWRDGKGYIGPIPDAGSATYTSRIAEIRKQFAPYDACGEGLNAIEDAFAMEAQISAIPMEPVEDPGDDPGEGEAQAEYQRKLAAVQEQKEFLESAVELLSALWDRVRLHEELKPAIRSSAWAERGVLGWWIPPGRALRGTDGMAMLPRAESLEAAAEWLALSRPVPDAAAIVVDQPTQERAAVFLDEIVVDGTSRQRAVIAFIADDETIWRTVYKDDEQEEEEMTLQTGGVLPMAEMRGDNLLTPSVIATQMQLDYCESILTRTIETSGFRERYISNAEPTGVWTKLASGEVPIGPTREFDGAFYQLKPQPRTLGAAVTTELVGIVTPTDDGKQARATPSIESFDPTDPDFAIKAGQHVRAKILKMMRQGHRVEGSTAETSGMAYQQARAAFEKDLLNRKGAAEGMLRDLLTGALGMIEALAGKQGYFTGKLRIVVDMHVDAGPRSPEERMEDREDVKASLLSPETAISRNGVEDVDAELERIRLSARLSMLKEAAEIFDVISKSSSAEAAVRALIAAGIDPDIAKALGRVDTDSVVDL